MTNTFGSSTIKELFQYIDYFFHDLESNTTAIHKMCKNKDVVIIETNEGSFVKFLRTEVIQSEETFEGAMHKYYY